MKIFLDTNFIVYAAEKKIDFIEELDNLISNHHNLVLASSVLEELEKLAKKKSKSGISAEIAKKIIKNNKNKFKIIKTSLIPDNFIIKEIKPGDFIASMDRRLLEKIRNKKISISKNKKLRIS